MVEVTLKLSKNEQLSAQYHQKHDSMDVFFRKMANAYNLNFNTIDYDEATRTITGEQLPPVRDETEITTSERSLAVPMTRGEASDLGCRILLALDDELAQTKGDLDIITYSMFALSLKTLAWSPGIRSLTITITEPEEDE